MSIRTMPGFGKFQGCTFPDGLAYQFGMDSTDIHSNEAWGNSVTLVEIGDEDHDSLKTHDVDGCGKLNKSERKFVLSHEAALVFESSDGFVSVEWFKTEEEARKRFDSLESDYYGDDEDENEDEDDISDEDEE